MMGVSVLHSIVILEDDYIVRKALAENIDWGKHGFVVKGIAEDGEKGLELINKYRPDIIVSDIKMPFADGLEIARYVRDKYPESRVVLLTGYDEFEFIQEALRLRVYDYVMKPVEDEYLISVLKKAAEDINNQLRLKKQLAESMPVLRQQFLSGLLIGRMKREDIQNELKFHDIQFEEGWFCVYTIKVDGYQEYPQSKNLSEFNILKLNIKNTISAIFKKPCKGLIFDAGIRLVVILRFSECNEEQFFERSMETGEMMLQEVSCKLKTTITIGVGKVYFGYDNIPVSYEESLAALEYRHIFGKGQILHIDDTGFPTVGGFMEFKGRDRDIAMKVKLGLASEAISIMDGIEKELISKDYVSLEYLKLVAIEITFHVFKELENSAYSDAVRDINFFTIYTEINKAETINEIFIIVKDMINKFASFVNNQREKLQKSITEEAVKYVEENYSKENLSLREVSGHVHINPTYFSMIFKKEKGINFSKFLFEYRMKKAMEIIRNTDKKVYEVAEEVGFSNSQYFSVCFKKYTGMSPLEYRRIPD
jgi:two-component system response regulator YesN